MEMERSGVVREGRMCPVRMGLGRLVWGSMAVWVLAAEVPFAMVTWIGW